MSALDDTRAGDRERAELLLSEAWETVLGAERRSGEYAAVPSWFLLGPRWRGRSSAYAAVPSWCATERGRSAR